MNSSSSPLESFSLPSPVRIGWIGTGVMGEPMCEHLLGAGYGLSVFTRTPSKAQPLLDQGARWVDTPSALVAETDVICTMVGFPEDVRGIYLGSRGVLSQARAGQIFVDFTTSDPTLAYE